MSRHPHHHEGKGPRASPYRVSLVDELWQVMRPHGSVPHAFDRFDDALNFVRSDSHGMARFVEVLIGSTYMVKQLDSLS